MRFSCMIQIGSAHQRILTHPRFPKLPPNAVIGRGGVQWALAPKSLPFDWIRESAAKVGKSAAKTENLHTDFHIFTL